MFIPIPVDIVTYTNIYFSVTLAISLYVFFILQKYIHLLIAY